MVKLITPPGTWLSRGRAKAGTRAGADAGAAADADGSAAALALKRWPMPTAPPRLAVVRR